MAMLGLGDYLCEACKHFDTDGGVVTISGIVDMVEKKADMEDHVILARLGYVKPVRCRDCKCFSVDQSDHEYRSDWWCSRWYTDMVEPDGYCAWGVRKKD